MLLKLGRNPAWSEPVREWVINGVRILVRRVLAHCIGASLAKHALELFNPHLCSKVTN